MRTNWFKSGDWNSICDICGFKRKASQMQERWDGLMVCSPVVKQGCWEIRHPQDLLKPIPDQQAVAWTRPPGNDIFLEDTFLNTQGCSSTGVLSQADFGEADCMTVGNVNGGLTI